MKIGRSLKILGLIAIIAISLIEWPTIAQVVSPPQCPSFNQKTISGCLKYVYSVKFVCGNITDWWYKVYYGLEPSEYQTLINIHNPSLINSPASVIYKFSNSTTEAPGTATSPDVVRPASTKGQYILSYAILEPDAVTTLNCFQIENELLPTVGHTSFFNVPECSMPMTSTPVAMGECPLDGYVVVFSNLASLDVGVVYTTQSSSYSQQGAAPASVAAYSVPAVKYVP